MSGHDPKNFLIMRNHRIKSLGRGNPNKKSKGDRVDSGNGYGAIGRWNHHVRADDTPNAEPERFIRNRVWCADTAWKGMHCDRNDPKLRPIFQEDYLANLTKRILVKMKVEEFNKLRSDSVILEEIMISISPPWFRHGDPQGPIDEERRKLFEDTAVKWLRKKYGDRLLAVVSHADETNPHLGAFVLPLVRKIIRARGQLKAGETRKQWHGYVLNASVFFSGNIYYKVGGKAREGELAVRQGQCAQNQTELVAYFREHGIDVERGIEASLATHCRMRNHVQALNYPLPALPNLSFPLESKPLETKKQFAARVYEDLQSQIKKYQDDVTVLYLQANAYKQADRSMREYQATAARERNARKELSAEVERLEKALAEQKLISANLTRDLLALKTPASVPARRIITLETVADALVPTKKVAPISRTRLWQLDPTRTLAITQTGFQIRKVTPGQTADVVGGQDALTLVRAISGTSTEEACAWIEKTFGTTFMEGTLRAYLQAGRKTNLESFVKKVDAQMGQGRPKSGNQGKIPKSDSDSHIVQVLTETKALSFIRNPDGSLVLNWYAAGELVREDYFDAAGKLFKFNRTDEWLWVRKQEDAPNPCCLILPQPADFLALSKFLPDLIDTVGVVIADAPPEQVMEDILKMPPNHKVLLACPWPEFEVYFKKGAAKAGRTLQICSPSPFQTWAEVSAAGVKKESGALGLLRSFQSAIKEITVSSVPAVRKLR